MTPQCQLQNSKDEIMWDGHIMWSKSRFRGGDRFNRLIISRIRDSRVALLGQSHSVDHVKFHCSASQLTEYCVAFTWQILDMCKHSCACLSRAYFTLWHSIIEKLTWIIKIITKAAHKVVLIIFKYMSFRWLYEWFIDSFVKRDNPVKGTQYVVIHLTSITFRQKFILRNTCIV